MPIKEVVVFRTLVTILSQEPANDADILKHMKRALARQSEVGADLFFGKCEVGRRERNWLAANAWNFGVRSGQEKNYELSAEFFKLASEFYKIVGDGETEANEEMVCKSIILAVSAIIADEKHHKGTLQEAEIRQAIELLGRAGKVYILITYFYLYIHVRLYLPESLNVDSNIKLEQHRVSLLLRIHVERLGSLLKAKRRGQPTAPSGEKLCHLQMLQPKASGPDRD